MLNMMKELTTKVINSNYTLLFESLELLKLELFQYLKKIKYTPCCTN